MEHIGTILIVDDNADNLQVLSGVLVQAGYRVRPALSGDIALRAAEVSVPDLVLLDVRMPGMDGYETCRRLHANPLTRDVPVIFISAMADTEDKLAGFRAGGVDYLPKPFQPEEVLARVGTHMALHRMQQHLERAVQERTRDLTASEARYRILFDDSPLAILVYDAENRTIATANMACAGLVGVQRDQLLGTSLESILGLEQCNALMALTAAQDGPSPATLRTQVLHFNRGAGLVLDTQGVVKRIEYAGRTAYLLMLQDVTEQRQAQEQLQIASKEHQRALQQVRHHDALTGLPNRELLVELMRTCMAQTKQDNSWVAVCYLDIDDFKPVNDAHGKVLGDQLLFNVAECLRACMHEGDVLARIAGDEFVFLLQGLTSDAVLNARLQQIQKRLGMPFASDDWSVSLKVSIGVAVYPHDDVDPDILLRHAALAMMQAKQGGKNQAQRFDPYSDKKVRNHQESVAQMREALLRREFVLFYQPKVDLLQRRVFGVEALIRWQHPKRGLLPPGVFLPEIENDALMVELGDWVIDEALGQLAQWRQSGLDLAVSVNVAAIQLAQPQFMERLQQHLERHPETGAHRLELEVLETSALDDVAKIEQLIVACRAVGVGFSLDDFGTGYSSLTYLRRLSADTLKIDQSFVRDMLRDPGDQAIVSGVIGLANAFSRKVIAEGVETVAHGKALLQLGCHLLQGYGLARPMPAGDLPGWAQNWPDSAWTELAADGHAVLGNGMGADT